MKRKTQTFRARGMFCAHCERRIADALRETPGVEAASADWSRETVRVTYDADAVTSAQLRDVITGLGYEASSGAGLSQTVSVLVILLAAYLICGRLGLTAYLNVFPEVGAGVGFGMLFVMGLLTSVHCIAMCGGVNLSQSAAAAGGTGSVGRANLLYNGGRVLSYTVIGALAGGIGRVLVFSGRGRGVVAVLAGLAMLVMALRMLGLFKPLRRFRLPAGLTRRAGRLLRGRSSFVIGLFNGLMPCGPLQSMQLYALSAGGVWQGALSMLLFGLGTVPLMLSFGWISGRLNRKYARSLLTVSAVLIFVMGVHTAANGLALSGVGTAAKGTRSEAVSVVADGRQEVVSAVDYGSYEAISVKKGVPVVWILRAPEEKLNGCNREILVPAFGIDLTLQPGENMVTFTPEEAGTYPFSCWMGMIKSYIEVTE